MAYMVLEHVQYVRSVPEMEAELQWLAKRIHNTITSPVKFEDRLHGTYVDIMLFFYLTGELKTVSYGPSSNDMIAVLNMFSMAPPHVQKVLEPLVGDWKIKAFGDPDIVSEPPKSIEMWVSPEMEEVIRFYEAENTRAREEFEAGITANGIWHG